MKILQFFEMDIFILLIVIPVAFGIFIIAKLIIKGIDKANEKVDNLLYGKDKDED